MIPLRPYQEEAVNAAREVVKVGGHPLIANATGTGKTRLGLAICATAISRGRWCLWLAYGVSLLRQTVKAGEEFGIVGEAVAAPKTWPVAPFMAVSLATLAADGRFEEFKQAMGSPPAVVIWDEAHEVCGPQAVGVRRALEAWGARVHVGLSATPETPGLGDLFTLAYHYGVRRAQRDGYLCRETVDVDAIITRRDMATQTQIVVKERGDPVEHVLRRVGSRAIVFSARVARAQEIAERLTAAGKRAIVLTGATPEEERAAAFEAFERGEVDLCSADLLTTGVDLPSCDLIVLDRLGDTATLLRQIIGRGLRLSPGKKGLVVVDLYGVTQKIALDGVPVLLPFEPEVEVLPGEEELAQLAGADLLAKVSEKATLREERTLPRVFMPKWVDVAPGVQAVSGGKVGTVMLLRVEGGYRIGWVCPKGSKVQLFPPVGCKKRGTSKERREALSRPLSRGAALAAAKDVLRQAAALVNPRAAWRREDPTGAAIEYAERLGLRWAPGETAGELSDRCVRVRCLRLLEEVDLG